MDNLITNIVKAQNGIILLLKKNNNLEKLIQLKKDFLQDQLKFILQMNTVGLKATITLTPVKTLVI